MAEAYRRAYTCSGLSEQAICVEAQRVFWRAPVQARLDVLQAEARARSGVTADRVIEEFAAVAFSDIREVLSVQDGVVRIRDLDTLPQRVTRAVSSIKAKVIAVDKQTLEDGSKVEYDVLQIEVKMHDKLVAANALGRNLGLFKRDNEQQAQKAEELLRLWGMIDGRTRGLPSMHTEPGE